MNRYFANKTVRLVLAFSISIWMAGGCLFGCSNSAMAADSPPAVDAGESCHAVQSHHCCATKKAKKQVVRNVKQPIGLPAFAPGPRELMLDCPLAVNATAATSKSSTHVPDPGRVPVAVLPSFEKQTVHADNVNVVSFLPNLGPTHLRCCVFLI
ncbi:MAG TPA: hypothetical protein VIW64_08970 [Pyrinomonadaceae bacterium]|jgi:hypothetical protein